MIYEHELSKAALYFDPDAFFLAAVAVIQKLRKQVGAGWSEFTITSRSYYRSTNRRSSRSHYKSFTMDPPVLARS
jgi:hypothetical protein